MKMEIGMKLGKLGKLALVALLACAPTYAQRLTKPHYAQVHTSEVPWADVTSTAYGASNNGTTDATSEVQAAATAATGGTLYFPPGTYLITCNSSDAYGTDGGISIPADTTVIISQGATIKCANSASALGVALRVVNVANVKILGGGTINGNVAGYTGGGSGFCIGLHGATDVTIRDVTLQNCWSDGIYLGLDGAGGDYSDRVTIDNVRATASQRAGLTIVAGDNVNITNSRFDTIDGTSPESGINITPTTSTDTIGSITIDNNILTGNTGDGLHVDLTQLTDPECNLTISNNAATSNTASGIYVANVLSGRVTIANNTCTTNATAGASYTGNISIYDVDAATAVVGNTLTNAATGDNVSIACVTNATKHVRVSGNVITGGLRGIYALGYNGVEAQYISVSDNTISGAAHEGIRFYNVKDGTINGNLVADNNTATGYSGIYTGAESNCSRQLVSNNTITGAHAYGTNTNCAYTTLVGNNASGFSTGDFSSSGSTTVVTAQRRMSSTTMLTSAFNPNLSIFNTASYFNSATWIPPRGVYIQSGAGNGRAIGGTGADTYAANVYANIVINSALGADIQTYLPDNTDARYIVGGGSSDTYHNRLQMKFHVGTSGSSYSDNAITFNARPYGDTNHFQIMTTAVSAFTNFEVRPHGATHSEFRLYDDTDGAFTGWAAPAAMGLGVTDAVLTMPNAYPAAPTGYFLTCSDAGVCSWGTLSAGLFTAGVDYSYLTAGDDLGLGGDGTAANAYSLLYANGAAEFNVQQNAVDFIVNGDTAPSVLHVNGTDGNVGINTAAPSSSYKLVVNGDLYADSLTTKNNNTGGPNFTSILENNGYTPSCAVDGTSGQMKLMDTSGTGSVYALSFCLGTTEAAKMTTSAFTPPQSATPTTAAEGEMAWDTNANAIEVYDATAAAPRLIPTLYTAQATIVDPDAIGSTITTDIPMLSVESGWAPGGIVLTTCGFKQNGTGTYSINVVKRTSPTAAPTTLDSLSGTGAEVTDPSPSVTTVAASEIMYVQISDVTTDLNYVQVWCEYYVAQN